MALLAFSKCAATRALIAFCALMTLCIGARWAHAQDASATANGVVSDPSGAAVPNAQVRLTNTQTAVSKITTCNNNGAYAFLNIVPGVYTLQATAPGFASQTQPNITFEVNQTATIDFHLTVGTANTTVTVEAAAANVETATAELGTVVNTREVSELPLNGRNFTQLLTITPGVVNIHTDQSGGGGGGFVGNALGSFSFPSVNGSRVRSNAFLLDGVNNMNTFLTTYNFQPIVDDIQEFKTQGHNDLAEYGGVTGGIVNVVSKSGTNDYHGTLWEFLRNEQMDARGFFDAARTPLRQNQFGVAAGGPVWIPKLYRGRNKSFFYAGYEAYRQRLLNESGTLVPTDAQRNGDFSAMCTAGFTNGLCNNVNQQLFNPFTTTYNAATNSYSRQPFLNNQILPNLINPIAAAYQTLIPHAQTLINGNNYFQPGRSKTNQDSGSIRGDQYIRNSDQVMFRFSKYYQIFDSPANVTGVQDSDIYGYNIAAHETHTFGPTAILDVYFGRNYGNDKKTSFLQSATTSSFLTQLTNAGLSPAMLTNEGYTFAPSISVAGYIGTPYSYLQATGLADVFQYGGSFAKIIGKHTLKVGMDFETNNFTSPIRYTNESFGSAQTGALGANQGAGGDAWASFLLGVPNNAAIRGVNEANHGGWDNAFFIQDQWKVTDRLTVNLGFRDDMKITPIYGSGRDLYTGDADAVTGQYILTSVPPNCSPTVGAPCIPNGTYVQGGGPVPWTGLPPHVIVAGSDHRIVQNVPFNWAGRVGLGYRLTDKIAVRAGYGRFYDMWGAVTQLAQNFGGNWPAVATINNPLLNQYIPTGSMADPLGLGSGSGGLVYPPATFSQVSQWMVDPKFKTPYMDQWNFGVEDQVMSNTVLSVNYVGSVGRHLDWGPEQNTAVTPGPGNFQDRQPFPYMLPQWFDQSVGNSRYNALQVSVNRRTSHGMAFLVSYTLSRSTDDGCSADIGADCSVQNVYNRAADVGVSSFNEKQVFSASFSAESPFGSSKWNVNRFVNAIAGGWLFNGIVQLGSGFPYEVDASNSVPNVCGCNTERANLTGDPYSGNLGVNTTWFNTAAFAKPAAFTFGNERRNSLVGDWQRNVDLSLFRQFHIGLGDTRYFEFRAEAFNVLNNVVFSNPIGSMTDPNYGKVTSQANSPRQLQLGLKFYF